MVAAVNDEDNMDVSEEYSRAQLDSHANVEVVGRHALIIIYTGQKAEVGPFSPDYEVLKKVPIFDAAICYTCPHNDKIYILIVKYSLSVPSMKKI